MNTKILKAACSVVLLTILYSPLTASAGTTVRFTLQDFGLNSVTNRKCIVGGVDGPFSSGGGMVIKDPIPRTSDTNGVFYITNLASSVSGITYAVQVLAPPALTVFYIQVTNSASILNAHDLQVQTVTSTAVTYTKAQIDAMFAEAGANVITNNDTRGDLGFNGQGLFVRSPAGGPPALVFEYITVGKTNQIESGNGVFEFDIDADQNNDFVVEAEMSGVSGSRHIYAPEFLRNGAGVADTNMLNASKIYIYAADYGAVADDVTDNRVPVQKAIDFARTNGGGTVLLPKGTLHFTPVSSGNHALYITNFNNVRVLGHGAGVTRLKWFDSVVSSDGSVIRVNQATNITFESFTVHGNKTGRGLTGSADFEGINIDASAHISITGVEVVDCAGDGFDVENCYDVRVVNNYVRDSGGVGFSFQGHGLLLQGNYFTNNGIFTGSGDADNAAIQITQSSDVTVVGNVCVNNRRTFYATSSAFVVTGNSFTQQDPSPFTGEHTNLWIVGNQGVISGNVMTHSIAAGGPNILLEDVNNGNGINISGNFIYGSEGYIRVRNCANAVKISGNIMAVNQGVIATNSPKLSIVGNRIAATLFGIRLQENMCDANIVGNEVTGAITGIESLGNSTNISLLNNAVEGTIYTEHAERWKVVGNKATGAFTTYARRSEIFGNTLTTLTMNSPGVSNVLAFNFYNTLNGSASASVNKFFLNYSTTMDAGYDSAFWGVLSGDGSGLTSLNASQLTSGTVPSAALGNAVLKAGDTMTGDLTIQANGVSTVIRSNTVSTGSTTNNVNASLPGAALIVAATASPQLSASVAGSAVTLKASDGVAGTASGAGAGGKITITAGDAKSFSGSALGGAITITSGQGVGNGAGGSGGDITIKSGRAGNNGSSGAITISTGAGTSANSAPGLLTIAGGDNAVTSGGTLTGGALTLKSGAAGTNWDASVTASAGGDLTVTGGAGGNAIGTGGTGGTGSVITITSGAGGNATGASGTRTGGNSGNVNIRVGAVGIGASANGNLGVISFQVPSGTEIARISSSGIIGDGSGLTNIPIANGVVFATQSSVIDATAATTTTIFTVPTGKRFFLTGYQVEVVSTDSVVIEPQVNLTTDSGVTPVWDSVVVSGNAGNFVVNPIPSSPIPTILQGEDVEATVIEAATATAYDIRVNVTGYYMAE